jgi:glycosyltransferase involved in cell wall biosynthesis
MIVLHITPAFYPAHVYGGPIESVYQLCRHLGQAGCEVRVLTTDANGPKTVLNVETLKEVEIAPGLTARYCHRIFRHTVSPNLIRLLPSYLRQADLVHITSVYSFSTIPALLMCRILRKPIVWSPRGSFQRWDGSRRMLAKFLWEKICQVVAPEKMLLHTTSEREARESGERMPGIHLAVIPNGVVVPERVSHIEGGGVLRLLYLGRLHPIKGIENLLNACRILNEKYERTWSLTIAGVGDPDYVKCLSELIEQLSLGRQVTLVGGVGGEDKEELFERTDVLILPSHSENFGLVVAEALAHAVPVIASTGTPWAELEKRGCGLWADNSPEGLAEAISRIRHKALPEMGARGRAWMKGEFGWETIAAKMFDAYRTLV